MMREGCAASCQMVVGAAYTSVISTVDHGATETVKVGSLFAPDASQRQFVRVRITRQ